MEGVNEESPGQTMSENLRIDATIARAAIISETVVFCTLVILGGGLIALFATTNLNWYYPTVFYGVVVYIAWQRYFGISVRAVHTTQPTQEQVIAAWEAAPFIELLDDLESTWPGGTVPSAGFAKLRQELLRGKLPEEGPFTEAVRQALLDAAISAQAESHRQLRERDHERQARERGW